MNSIIIARTMCGSVVLGYFFVAATAVATKIPESRRVVDRTAGVLPVGASGRPATRPAERKASHVAQRTNVFDDLTRGPQVIEGLDVATYDPLPSWSSGIEFTLLKPRFERNIAFTRTESDGATFESLSDTEFDYDVQLAPRLWADYRLDSGLGFRAQYWQFDHSPATASGTPPANGFGTITHPQFGDVDITTTIPGETFTASSVLNAYTIDLEATKHIDFSNWWMTVSSGIRYASMEQQYVARLRDTNGNVEGALDFRHNVEGVGPTFALAATRPVGCTWTLFSVARGSLLIGDGQSRLTAGEDLDLTTPFTTNRTTQRDDLIPIGELQLGIEWAPSTTFGWQPFGSVAMESQLWSGTGSAASEDGDVGFFGVSIAVGCVW